MIEAIKTINHFGLTNFNFFENFFSPILFRNSIVLDGAGNEKPPVEELESEKEIFSPEIKEPSQYLCDRILHHDLNEGIGSLFDIGREILKAAYAKNNTYTKLTQKPLTSYVIDSAEPVVKPVSFSKQTDVTNTQLLENYSGVISYNKADDAFTTGSYAKEMEYGTYDSDVLDYSQQTYISTEPGLLTYNTLMYEPLQKEADIRLYSTKTNFELPSLIEAKPTQEYFARPESIREIETQKYSFVKPLDYSLNKGYETNISQFDLQETELKIPEISFSESNLLENIIDSTPKSNISTTNEVLDYHLSQILSNSETKTEDYALTSDKSKTIDSKPIMQSLEEMNYLETAKVIPLTPRLKGFVNSNSSGIDLELKLQPEEPETHQLKQDPRYLEDEKKSKTKNCEATSGCYEEVLSWMDGKNVNLSEEKMESLSQCYATEISKIQKAREYLKTKKDGYDALTLKRMQNSKHKLTALQEDGFYLAEHISVNENSNNEYTLIAENVKTHQQEQVKVNSDSVYAVIDKHLKKKGLHGVFRVDSYIDTDTGKERQGLYLKTIAEYHLEAQNLLGSKDKHGMDLNGIIVLINGKEPGQGTTALDPLTVKKNDVVSIVYKNDAAIYKSNGPSLKKAA